MKSCVHLWDYLAYFFLDWEMFQIALVKKNHTFYIQQLFLQNRANCEIM